MKYPVFSYRDKYTTFMAPFTDQSEEAAMRGFAYAINNNPGIMGFAPSDFDLYQIGEFDSESGEIKGLKANKFICNGVEVFNEK